MRYRKILLFYAAAIGVGLLTGFVGSLFQLAIDTATRVFSVIQHHFEFWGIPGWITAPLLTLAMVFVAWILVKCVAPEAAGSGVQEIEGALKHERTIRWARILPVKFFGGMLAIASHMVLGREGPTIQIGGSLGQYFGEMIRFNQKRCDALVAAGAAAGLATAFNAPLAGVLFVMEEMRETFALSFIQFKTVAISCVAATIVLHLMLGAEPAIPMAVFSMPKLSSMGLFVIFGILVGFMGIFFSRTLMRALFWMDKQSLKIRLFYLMTVALLVGLLAYFFPEAVGGGYRIIEDSLILSKGLVVLIFLFVVRFVLTILCYGTGIPGGIFAPLLALGTLLGFAFSASLGVFLEDVTHIHPGMFAVAGMGALFSAVIRAPITGIVLVVEMTQNYDLILPLMVSCLTATTIVQLAGVSPIYALLLRRTMRSIKSC